MKNRFRKTLKFIKNNPKKLFGYFYIAFVSFTIFLGSVIIASVFNFRGMRVLNVRSGSMKPAIPPGSIIVIAPDNSYREGNVITFNTKGYTDGKIEEKTLTHRIVEVKKDNEEISYITKGDYNPDADREEVRKTNILGRVILMIPFLGYASVFAKTPIGFLLLVIIPGILIIVNEVTNIKKNIYKTLA